MLPRRFNTSLQYGVAAAAAASLLLSSVAFAQSGYNTPTGKPDGKVTIIVPEGQTLEPTYVPDSSRDLVVGAKELFNPNRIRYISGGVGREEQERIKAAEANYPVKVTFAAEGGAFLSDIQVDVKDGEGKDILSLITDGPVLLMDLQPGTYTLTASNGTEAKEHTFSLKKKLAFAVRFPKQ